MDKKAKLQDPYESLTAKDKTVTSLTTSDPDRAYLFSLCPQQSVLQVTANRLIFEFCKAMRKAGYKHYDPSAYVKALSSVKITIGETNETNKRTNQGAP